MSLIAWIDKADDQILTDKARPDDKVEPITQLLPNSWPNILFFDVLKRLNWYYTTKKNMN